MRWPTGQASRAIVYLVLGLGLAAVVRAHNDSTTDTSIVITTINWEIELANRGNKKFGDKCDNTQECGFIEATCDEHTKKCVCPSTLPITNHIDKCGKEAGVNESCSFTEECESVNYQTECRDGRCVCRFDLTPVLHNDGTLKCTAVQKETPSLQYIDPAMIGVLVGMALMFIIICVVLRLFSKARWRENRTIFNTPNPRLMNVSLLRDSKLLHQDRRNSKGSVRGPSRQPSMASLRPHSPNSQGSRRGSKGSSNASPASDHSTKSPSHGAPLASASAATTPMLESVTVEVQKVNA